MMKMEEEYNKSTETIKATIRKLKIKVLEIIENRLWEESYIDGAELKALCECINLVYDEKQKGGNENEN